MPDNPIDEVKEMNDVFDDIMDKTDEEIQKEAEEAAKKSDEPGEANKDQMNEADLQKIVEDPIKPDTDQTPESDTSDEVTVLKAKVEELEAELKKEHQRTSSWDGRIKSANNQVKVLEEENQTLKDQLASKPAETNEDNQSDQEIMDNFKSTFPEMVEVLDIYLKKMDAKATPPSPAKEDNEIEPDLTDPTQEDMDSAQKEHMSTIRKAHPAIDEMVSQGVILTWINQQPDFISPHLDEIYHKGNSDQIIKMVTEFQKKTGWKSSLNTGDKAKQDKLKSMLSTDGDSPGPKSDGPDKNDFAGAAKEAGL